MIEDDHSLLSRLVGADRAICAPMVLGSELAFRMLVRKYGIKLCYTPMLKAPKLVERDPEELRLLETCDGDRPLVVQLCGCRPEELSEAIRVVREFLAVDAFDFNLGCPQECASAGGYGAFLQDKPETISTCVKAMVTAADPSPVFCKARILESTEKTVQYALMLQSAGCSALALHCRTRDAKHNGQPDFEHLAAVVAALSVPVIANGGISSREQGRAVLAQTGASAFMSATALLRCPRSFAEGIEAHPISMALEYLDFAERYPPPSPLYIRKHLRWIFRAELQPAYLSAQEQCKGTQLPDDWANICHAYYRDGQCKHGDTCRWRHVQNPMMLKCGSTDVAGVRKETGLGSWRAKAWTFLERPYLEDICQFREVVKLIAHHLGHDLPDGMKFIDDEVPDFSRIRHCSSCKLASDEDAPLSIDWLAE